MSRRVYDISVTGEMGVSLRDAFEDVEITVDHSVTRMRVVSPDSSVVHGVLRRIEVLGLELLNVRPVDETPSVATESSATDPVAVDRITPSVVRPSHPERAYRRREAGPSPGPATPQSGGNAMAIGPVEYIIVGFPGNQFTGEIAPELGKLVESGTIRILDLVFISKDAEDVVTAVEFEDHDDVALFSALDGDVGGFISDEDIEYAAAELEPNSSAALLIWEDLWATPFVEAMRNSGGVLIEGSRIPHDLIEAAEAELAAAG